MKPVLHWVGGKKDLWNEIHKLSPKEFDRFVEPFVGGGHTFINFGKKSVISDANSELVNCYRQIACSVEGVIAQLELFKAKYDISKEVAKELYYDVRKMDRSDSFITLPPEYRAARTIFLNKATYNGLYRVNLKGEFNCSFGTYKKKGINFNFDNLRNLSKFLRENVAILNMDFEQVLDSCVPGDFVYLDPPYDGVDFVAYTGNRFGWEDQVRLAEAVKRAVKRGVKCMLSNNDTDRIRSLYKDFRIHSVMAPRKVNSKADGRGNVPEVIITTYDI